MTPTETVREFIRRIEANDLAAAVELVSDDCEYDNVPIGKVHGPDGIRGALSGFLDAFDTIEWPITRESADGNTVFNERIDRFVGGDRTLELPVVGVWEVVDGKITLWRDYFDLATLNDQR